MMKEIRVEENIFDCFNTPFQNECEQLINKISNRFEVCGFTDKYKEYKKSEITYDEFENFIYETLEPLDEKERNDFNTMYKMLSQYNCWYGDYDIGEVVHKVLVERIWFKRT